MFVHDMKFGESIKVGDVIVTVQSKSGQTFTIVIDAPRDVPIQTSRDRKKKEAIAPQEPV